MNLRLRKLLSVVYLLRSLWLNCFGASLHFRDNEAKEASEYVDTEASHRAAGGLHPGNGGHHGEQLLSTSQRVCLRQMNGAEYFLQWG